MKYAIRFAAGMRVHVWRGLLLAGSLQGLGFLNDNSVTYAAPAAVPGDFEPLGEGYVDISHNGWAPFMAGLGYRF